MIRNHSVPDKVNPEDISDDEFFKVSKTSYPVTLTASLKNSGMLEYPYIIKTESGCIPLTCHNRIKILREHGTREIYCFVLDKPDVNIFLDNVAIKSYRNEIGPYGRIKTLSLLSSCFNIDGRLKNDFCTKILKIPSEFLKDDNHYRRILGFPENLLNYLDEKDIGFKIIKDILILPDNWIFLINKWISDVPVRVNIFRMLIDHLFDIYRRGDDFHAVETVSFNDDKTLYGAVFRMRFPEYSMLKNKSDGIINELNGSGLTIEFPEYFDRGFLSVRLDIDKKSECSAQLEKISKMNIEKLKQLLSFL